MSTAPTPQDRENAEMRQAVAARQAEQIGRAMLAVGIGHEQYFAWVLHDRLGLEPDVLIYGYRDRGTGPVPGANDLPDWTMERVAGRPIPNPLTGGVCYPFRWETRYWHFEEYHPRSAEQLSAAREKRDARAVEKMALANPLFAEQVKAGEWAPSRKPRPKAAH